MTLQELSAEYREQAEVLHQRIALLRRMEREASCETEKMHLRDRRRILTAMWRETRDIAVLTEHYYERSRCRNAKYIL